MMTNKLMMTTFAVLLMGPAHSHTTSEMMTSPQPMTHEKDGMDVGIQDPVKFLASQPSSESLINFKGWNLTSLPPAGDWKKFTKLHTVHLGDNPNLKSVAPLRAVENTLKVLSLFNTGFSDTKELGYFIGMEILTINNTKVTEIKWVYGLPKLQKFSLQDNPQLWNSLPGESATDSTKRIKSNLDTVCKFEKNGKTKVTSDPHPACPK